MKNNNADPARLHGELRKSGMGDFVRTAGGGGGHTFVCAAEAAVERRFRSARLISFVSPEHCAVRFPAVGGIRKRRRNRSVQWLWVGGPGDEHRPCD